MCVTGKKLSELLKEIYDIYGVSDMYETDYKFSAAKKEELIKFLFVDKYTPDFGIEADKISYADGLKVYFKNGGWIIARFSGTEPLIRIFCEMETIEEAKRCCEIMREFLGL